jgi:outer membrane immunogenic protein
MRNQLKYSASVAALALASGLAMAVPAAAADFGPSAAPALSWQGFYLGGHIGTGEANTAGEFKGPAPSSSTVPLDFDLSGVLGGVHAGYNWDFGRLVAGVEGDWTGMDWQGLEYAPDSSEVGRGTVDALYSIRGRLGVTPDAERRVLLYGTVGAAWIDAQVETASNDGFFDGKNSFDGEVGVVGGGGVEWAASNNVRLRMETLYYNFDESQTVNNTSANAGDFVELEDVWTARVGVSWYFKGPF